jgi:mono/diheme cytochrome c family protein
VKAAAASLLEHRMAGHVPAMPRLAPVVMMRASIGYVVLSIAIVSMLALVGAPATAEEAQSFPMEQIVAGAELYAVNCSPCHGARMQDPGAAFNLRKFPPDQRDRFVNSITRGKNQMPPWGDFFKPDQLDALWAYIMAGER